MKVTIFRDIWTITEPLFVDFIVSLTRIKDGSSKELVEKIKKEKNKEKRNELKKHLPSICFSGKFSQREENYLLQHSGLICLDVDGISENNILEVKKKICLENFVLSCFISPSGLGLKVIVKIPPLKDLHRKCFLALEEYFNDNVLGEFLSTNKNLNKQGKKIKEEHGEYLKLCIDKSGKDINRVCYESFDENLYYNEDSDIWDTILEEKIIQKPIAESEKIIEYLQKWIDKNEIYQDGQRNSYLTKFCYALCRYGVDETHTEIYFRKNFSDYPENETKSLIKSIYKKAPFNVEVFTKEELEGKQTKKIESPPKNISEFWVINDKGKVKIESRLLLDFIEANGYGVYRYKSDPNKIFFIQSKNMIVDFVGVKDIKDCVLDFVEKNAPELVFDELQNKNRYFESTYLNALKEIKVEQIRDKENLIYFFFENFYYEVTKNEIEKKTYPSLNGKHIWRSQLCKKTINEIVDHKKSNFNNFILRAVTGNKNFELNDKIERYESAVTSLGYCLHTYKKMSNAKMFYASDDVMSEIDGQAEGGNGKNVMQKALEFARSVVYVDGKTFDKKDKFNFQNVSEETQIVVIDDYEGDIKELFAKITGNFGVEQKGVTKMNLEFDVAPKIAVSSNQSPSKVSNSFKRRIQNLEFSNYYGENLSPAKDFGNKDFFSTDWTQNEWNELYSFMFFCCQEYLKTGLKTYKSINNEQKQMYTNTNIEFTEFCEEKIFEDFEFNLEEYYLDYQKNCRNDKDTITKNKFISFLKIYAKVYGFEYVKKGKYRDDTTIKFVKN